MSLPTLIQRLEEAGMSHEEFVVLSDLGKRPNRIDALLPCEWRYIHSRLPALLKALQHKETQG